MPPDNDVQQEIEQLEQRFAENAQGLVFAHLADAYRRANEFAKAEGLILHGLKSHPTYISAYNVLGRVYLDSERFADAHEQFSKVLELDPQNLIALRALGDLALRGGRLEDARSWYERILQIDPRNEEAQEALARLEAPGATPQEPPAPSVPAMPEPSEAVSLEPLVVEEADAGLELALAEGSLEGLDIEPVEDEGFVEPIEGLEPVEGLVNKETMTASRDDVPSEPELESASSVRPPEVSEEARPEAAGESMPWERLTDLESLDEKGAAAEAEAVTGEGEPGEAFEESIMAGFSAGDPDLEVRARGDAAMDLDLKDMEEWTPGYLHEEDLTAEKGAELGAESVMGDSDDEFNIDFGEVTGEPVVEAEALPPEGGETVVTETMAELYADQALYEDALGVYRQLAAERPDDWRLKNRIEELEQKVEETRSTPAAGFELEELLELSEPRVPAEYDTAAGPAKPSPEAVEPPPVEPVVASEPAFAAAPPAADEGEFRFADEAPVAGIEQLDPFAASFDALVQKDGQPEPALQRPEPEVPMPGFEGPVPVTVEGVPLAAAAEPDILPPGADIRPPVELGMPATAALGESKTVPTIEDYLARLLAFDPDAPRQSPPAAAAQQAAPEPPATEPSPPTGSDDDGGEDLEQFQEWLKGLKS